MKRPSTLLKASAAVGISISFLFILINFTAIQTWIQPSPPDPVPALHPLTSRTLAGSSGAAGRKLVEAYGKLPLSFEANRGQTDGQVRFLSRGRGYTLFLTPEEAVLSLERPAVRDTQDTAPAVLRVRLPGAHPAPYVEGVDELPGKSHYFIGNDPQGWRTDIPTYARVRYRDVYPGVDLVFYGNQRQLEYDFIVSPGADPAAIRLGFEGAEALRLDEEGNLVLPVGGGEVVQRAPVVYQEIDGVRQEVSGRYALTPRPTHVGEGEAGAASGGEGPTVGFQVAAYDVSRPLIIDPVLNYSTFLGGGDFDSGHSIAVDGSGNAYVTGQTRSGNTIPFPLKDPLKPAKTGVYDAFVTKLNNDGSALVYSTYLGGFGNDRGFGIRVDGNGRAYVAGETAGNSAGFPTTFNAFRSTPQGGQTDAFAMVLSEDGSQVLYGTYLGGSNKDVARAIDIGMTEGLLPTPQPVSVYITGETFSSNFPAPSGFQPTYRGNGDAFVAKLDPNASSGGASLVYASFLGDSGQDAGEGIAVIFDSHASVAGWTNSSNFPTTEDGFQTTAQGGFDAFVVRVDPSGSALSYATRLGGGRNDKAYAAVVDTGGVVYVTGETASDGTNGPAFPTSATAFQGTMGGGQTDAFVTKLNLFFDPIQGSAPLYSTFLGGSGDEAGRAIDVEAACPCYAHITGETGSTNFPTESPVQATNAGGTDAFVTVVNPRGDNLTFSTYLGGSGEDRGRGIILDRFDEIYVTGEAGSNAFPTTSLAFQTSRGSAAFKDAFVTKLGVESGVGGFVYWSDLSTRKIQRADISGGPNANIEDVVTTGLSNPWGIALDVGTGKVYWTNDGGDKIQRADISGGPNANIEDVITIGLSNPWSSIALDVGAGKVYWSDVSTDKIQRADISGGPNANIEDVVTTGLSFPAGIALDVGAGKVYWCDRNRDKIRRASIDISGSPNANIEDVVTTGLINPWGIALLIENTATGLGVAAQASSSTTVTFGEVTQSGITTSTTSSSGPAPPSNFELLGIYYDISTTATVSSPIKVCIEYDDSGLSLAQENALTLSHYENGNWVDVTLSLDTASNIICGEVTSLSPFAIFVPEGPLAMEVVIDIRPGSDPNSINLKSKGMIPAAILTTSTVQGEPLDFDATSVDPLSVRFGPNGAEEAHGKGHPEDVDGDGDTDLVLHFKTQETGIQAGDTGAGLTGETFDGQAIEGVDAVQTVGGRTKPADSIPDVYSLSQNVPNPANPATQIAYQLPEAGEVSLVVYNLLGQEVRVLVQGHQEAGYYRVTWDGKDASGRLVSSGVYIYRLVAGGGRFTAARRMLLLK